ncbi:MAG: hypothetical protein K2O01_04115, partial [Bacteroidales bacterium]|nr:hypothetical protein [Bacteroidales bacterium]
MKKTLVWIVAVLLTLGSSVYQRLTGPTHPLRLAVETAAGQRQDFRLPRSGGPEAVRVAVPVRDVAAYSGASTPLAESAPAFLFYKHYPEIAGEAYMKREMRATGAGEWEAWLPALPAAGKWQYYVAAEGAVYPAAEPVVIRFKGHVPAACLIPHILFMFLSMLFITVAGGFALCKFATYKKYLYMGLASLLLGGFIFGPLVQHYAFGPYWTGFPMGTDLTDNKTLIMLLALMVAWGFEVFGKRFQGYSWATVAATVIVWVVFLIPHSLNGSERDPQ